MKLKKAISRAAILGSCLLATSCAAMPFVPRGVVCGEITDKERISEEISYYLIFIDQKPYKNEDDWSVGKWNSATLYGKAEIGEEICYEWAGWRIPLLSKFQNILWEVSGDVQ